LETLGSVVNKEGLKMIWWILLAIYLVGFLVFLGIELYGIMSGGNPPILEVILVPTFWFVILFMMIFKK